MKAPPNPRLAKEEVVWLLAGLSREHRAAFDAALFTQQHPPDEAGGYSVADLLIAAQELGLDITESGGEFSTPDLIGLPAFAWLNESGRAEPIPVLVTAIGSEQRVLMVLSATHPQPQTMAFDAFTQALASPVWGSTRRAEPLRDEDGATATAPAPFGFGWFAPELLKYRSVWRDVLAASLALQLVGLATPLFTQVVIDKVVVHQSQSTLVAAGVGLALAILFSAVFTWVRQYLILHTGNRVDAALGSRVFGHLLRLPMPYFARRPTGTLVARLHGVETIREFLAGAAVTLLLDLPFMLVLLAVMFWYSWQLSLIALSLLAILTVLSLVVSPMLRRRLDAQFLLGARNQAFVTEYVSGMETVKALQLEPQLDKRYGRCLAEYVSATFATRQVGNTYQTTANALEQLQGLAILVVGALLVMRNDGFTIGMLVAFQMFAGRLSQPLLRLVGLYQEFQQASLSVRRLGDLMNAPAEPYSTVPARVGTGVGGIELQGVSFRYSPEHPWLYRDLSLLLRPGKTTLVIGPSGSGKSTLAKLLLGFYRPQEGALLMDGQDIRHLAANELRCRFGVVPQDTQLFSGTVYDNLQMANPHSDFGQIVQACRMAEIHDAIEQLPQGYKTEIGEHGVGLSGGQKQRVAIARALLKRPRVLIFDEATSALDAKTASQFAATINQLRGKVTIVFIAHQVPRGLIVDETVIVGNDRVHDQPRATTTAEA